MAVIKHGSGATSAFKTVKVSGQSDVVADAGSDDLTLAAGSNVTITTNASTDTVTIASSGGGAALDGIDDQSSSNDDQLTITDTAVIINEDGDDVDFRVEGDTDANLFVCNAGDDKVAIGTDAPTHILTIKETASDSAGSGCLGFVPGGATDDYWSMRLTNTGQDLTFDRFYSSTDTEAVRIARATGRVGIGASAPAHLLELKPAALAANTTIAAAMTDGLGFNMGAGVADNEFAPALSWYSDDGSLDGDGSEDHIAAITAQAAEDYDATNDAGADLVFYTHPIATGGGVTEKLRITADGRGLSQFTAKAWASWQVPSGSVTLDDSHNVSSITDDGVGYFTVNFTNDLGNALYSVVGSAVGTYNGSIISLGQGGGDTAWRAVDEFEIECRGNTTGTTVRDPEDMCAIAFGD